MAGIIIYKDVLSFLEPMLRRKVYIVNFFFVIQFVHKHFEVLSYVLGKSSLHRVSCAVLCHFLSRFSSLKVQETLRSSTSQWHYYVHLNITLCTSLQCRRERLCFIIRMDYVYEATG